MKRYLTLTICLVMILSLFAGCGAASQNSVYMDQGEFQEMAAAPEEGPANDRLAAGAAPQADLPLPENRKWVITSEVRAETEDLDVLLEAVLGKVGEMSGYVEDQNIFNGSGYGDNRMARLTIRIPAEQVDAFLEVVSEQANVVSSSKNLEDITLQYVDTDSRLQALKTEETRLLELLEQAETMSDLLEIEGRLTDVRYEIETYTSRMRTYDNRVDYATVYLTMTEVREYTPVEKPGFLERITTGFRRSLRGLGEGLVDFAVWIIVSSPYLLVWGAVIAVAVIIVKKCRKVRKQRKKKAAQEKSSGEVPSDRKHTEESPRGPRT